MSLYRCPLVHVLLQQLLWRAVVPYSSSSEDVNWSSAAFSKKSLLSSSSSSSTPSHCHGLHGKCPPQCLIRPVQHLLCATSLLLSTLLCRCPLMPFSLSLEDSLVLQLESSWEKVFQTFASRHLKSYQHQDTCCHAAFQRCPAQGRGEPLQSRQGGSPPPYGGGPAPFFLPEGMKGYDEAQCEKPLDAGWEQLVESLVRMK